MHSTQKMRKHQASFSWPNKGAGCSLKHPWRKDLWKCRYDCYLSSTHPQEQNKMPKRKVKEMYIVESGGSTYLSLIFDLCLIVGWVFCPRKVVRDEWTTECKSPRTEIMIPSSHKTTDVTNSMISPLCKQLNQFSFLFFWKLLTHTFPLEWADTDLGNAPLSRTLSRWWNNPVSGVSYIWIKPKKPKKTWVFWHLNHCKFVQVKQSKIGKEVSKAAKNLSFVVRLRKSFFNPYVWQHLSKSGLPTTLFVRLTGFTEASPKSKSKSNDFSRVKFGKNTVFLVSFCAIALLAIRIQVSLWNSVLLTNSDAFSKLFPSPLGTNSTGRAAKALKKTNIKNVSTCIFFPISDTKVLLQEVNCKYRLPSHWFVSRHPEKGTYFCKLQLNAVGLTL